MHTLIGVLVEADSIAEAISHAEEFATRLVGDDGFGDYYHVLRGGPERSNGPFPLGTPEAEKWLKKLVSQTRAELKDAAETVLSYAGGKPEHLLAALNSDDGAFLRGALYDLGYGPTSATHLHGEHEIDVRGIQGKAMLTRELAKNHYTHLVLVDVHY